MEGASISDNSFSFANRFIHSIIGVKNGLDFLAHSFFTSLRSVSGGSVAISPRHSL